MQHLAREMPAGRGQRFLADVTMDDAKTATLSVEEDTLTTGIAGDGPAFLVVGACGSDKERTGVSLSSY